SEGPAKALTAGRQRLGARHRIGVGDTMRADALLLLQHQWRDAQFVPASIVLAPLRMRKSAEEIEALRRAAATADTAVQAAWRACRPGATEADIAAAVDAGFRAAGATEVKPAIVGSGPNSAFPHHHTGTRRRRSRRRMAAPSKKGWHSAWNPGSTCRESLAFGWRRLSWSPRMAPRC